MGVGAILPTDLTWANAITAATDVMSVDIISNGLLLLTAVGIVSVIVAVLFFIVSKLRQGAY